MEGYWGGAGTGGSGGEGEKRGNEEGNVGERQPTVKDV